MADIGLHAAKVRPWQVPVGLRGWIVVTLCFVLVAAFLLGELFPILAGGLAGLVGLLVGSSRDAARDREAREQIENSHRLLQTTLDALSAHVAILDEAGAIVAVNRAWCRFSAPDCGIGTNYLEACRVAAQTDPQAAPLAENLDTVLAGRRQEATLICAVGDRSFQVTVARFRHARTAHFVIVREDVTELISARQDVRDITGRLLLLQEEERCRIAADLHDSTAQHIVAAGLGLMQVQAAAGSNPKLLRASAVIRMSLNEAQREIRALSYLLYQPNLRAHGLTVSLRRFVEGFSQRTGLAGKARITGEVDQLPIDLQRAVLRVVQEALVNVHRHADASKVSIDLKRDEHEVHLRIADNGKGIAQGRVGLAPNGTVNLTSLGVGVPGMEARIRQFNGTMAIASGDSGTTIRASIPIPVDEARIKLASDTPQDHLRLR